MKRLMFCIIALSIVFVFTACGGKRDGAEGGAPDTSEVLDASADISGEATDPESEPAETAGENSVTEGTDSEPLTADNVSSAPTEDTVPATDAPVTLPSVTTPSPVTSPITAPPTTNPPVTNPPVTEPPHVTEPCRHVNTEVRNRLEATTSAAGYTGDTYCRECGSMLSCGWTIPRIQQIDPAKHSYYDMEMRILNEINAERAKAGLNALADGSEIPESNEDIHELLTALNTLFDGAAQLKDALPALTDGVSKLVDGAKALADGLTTFDADGVSKLTSAINEDLDPLLARAQLLIEAAQSYNNYSGLAEGMDGAVRFIYRTDAIE